MKSVTTPRIRSTALIGLAFILACVLIDSVFAERASMLNANGDSPSRLLKVSNPNLASKAVPASLELATVASAVPIITLSQTELRFFGLAGGPVPQDRAFRIINSGPVGSVLNFTISATQPWLSPAPSVGSLTSGESVEVTVTAITGGMAGGNYFGALNVIGNSGNSPQAISAALILNSYASVETANITSKTPDQNGYDLVHVQASGHAFGPTAAVPNVSSGSFLWLMMMDRSFLNTGETFDLTTSGWTAQYELYDRPDLFPGRHGGASRDQGQPGIISWSANGDFRVLPDHVLDMRARLGNPNGSGDDTQYGLGLLNSPITASLGTSNGQASANPYANALLTVQISQKTTNPISVNYVVTGTARAGVDFLPLPGSVTILPVASTAVIPIIPIETPTSTGGTVIVTLTAGNGYVLGTNRMATVAVVRPPASTCSVSDLTPITDPVALQFEAGNELDTTHLSAATRTSLTCLTTSVQQAGGHLTLNSAYRPPAYQAHLLEVWQKWQRLKDDDAPECQSLKTRVQTEINYHRIQNLQTTPANANGPHTRGIALDVNFNATGLARATVITLAAQCGLAHPLPVTDAVHFLQAPAPPPQTGFDPGDDDRHSGNGPTSPLETPLVAINVSQQIIDGHAVYNYQVINNNTLPIVSVRIGYDSDAQVSELSLPPLAWDYFNGLPAGSATAPASWDVGVVTQEESEYLSLSWRTSDAAQRILPGQTRQGFGVVLPHIDNRYLTSHWTVIFSNGTVLSAPLRGSTPPSGSALQFSAANYDASEGDLTATVSVVRSGDISTSASIDFATSDGTATQRRNYTTASGTLTFSPGEASKLFKVIITDDAYVDGNHTVNLNLSNAVGASAGNPAAATLTIKDNDTALPATNPIDEAGFFVRQHYADFLSRSPDQGGFDFWTGQITQCGSDQACIRNKRIDVSNAFYYELEFQQTASYVYRLYRAAFGNNQPFPNPNPDPAYPGEEKKIPLYAIFMKDRSVVRGGPQLAQLQLSLANAFVQRTEFQDRYPASLSTASQFVDALLATIQNDLGVNLLSQRAALINLYNPGGRAAVIYRLADDNLQTNPIDNRAFIDIEYNRAFVATQYFGYLRRNPDIGGFMFWLNQVNSGPLRDVSKQHAMVCSFITSAEYQLRFSPVVTHSNAECPQ